MRRAAALLGLMATQATAGGLDTTGQPITFIFSEGRVAEVSLGVLHTNLSGQDAAFLGGRATGNIAQNTFLPSFSYKQDMTDRLSFGILLERPFGAEIAYAPGASFAFGGTTAKATTTSLTALARYKLSERFSIHGGARVQSAEADFLLAGGIYGPFSGYTAKMEKDTAFGYVLGAAFEIPDYFLRVSLTYNSAITHDLKTTERSIFGTTVSTVSADTPQSWNLEFQSGIAPRTFVFGGARWVEWSALQFAPPVLSAASPDPLVDFKDTWTYTLGVGRQLTDQWTGTFAVLYEPSTDKTPTPLTPADGFTGIALGAIYSAEAVEVHLNAALTEIGNTTPYVSALGTTVSQFESNRNGALGVKFVYRY